MVWESTRLGQPKADGDNGPTAKTNREPAHYRTGSPHERRTSPRSSADQGTLLKGAFQHREVVLAAKPRYPITDRPVPGDVEDDEDQVRADGCADDRRDERRESGC